MEARSDSARNGSRGRTRRLWIGASVVALASLMSTPASAQQDERPVDRAADKVHSVNQSVEGYVSGKTIDVQYYRELRIEDFGVVPVRIVHVGQYFCGVAIAQPEQHRARLLEWLHGEIAAGGPAAAVR